MNCSPVADNYQEFNHELSILNLKFNKQENQYMKSGNYDLFRDDCIKQIDIKSGNDGYYDQRSPNNYIEAAARNEREQYNDWNELMW